MNKREAVLSLLDPNSDTPFIPAGFFLHFDPYFHRGKAAVEKHIEFFQFTDMDFVKIQYELTFPFRTDIQEPKDWSKLTLLDPDFFEDQWDLAEELVKAAGKEAMVIMTLYSPYMCAGQIVGRELLDRHIREDTEKIKIGMEIVTDSLRGFTDGCIQRGIDGFYHSTQGGETYRYGGSSLFDECIKPYDLNLMEDINQKSLFNILHICDYHDGYSDYSPFFEYPGDIVNCCTTLGEKILSGKEIVNMFSRPFMGGLDRHGIIVSGSEQEIHNAVQNVIINSPNDFILGADCTLPADVNWNNLKSAISYAHSFERTS